MANSIKYVVLVYAIPQGLPLRIILEFEGLPVGITMNATKVEPASIADSELQLDRTLFIKPSFRIYHPLMAPPLKAESATASTSED